MVEIQSVYGWKFLTRHKTHWGRLSADVGSLISVKDEQIRSSNWLTTPWVSRWDVFRVFSFFVPAHRRQSGSSPRFSHWERTKKTRPGWSHSPKRKCREQHTQHTFTEHQNRDFQLSAFLVGDDSPSKVLQDELVLRGCLALCILQVGCIQAFVAYWVEGDAEWCWFFFWYVEWR